MSLLESTFMKGYFRDASAMKATPAAKVWWGEKKGSDGKASSYMLSRISLFSLCNPASTIPAPPVQLLFILDAV